ncbi:hypothetical protein C8J56DRAFT_882967 [Mycena floridula]|nr:hypothetical protein C8J56DRAFT_882967 [Mycena floridula]
MAENDDCLFSQELLDIFLNFLHHDPKSLRLCTMASKKFLSRARKHLYRHLEIHGNKQPYHGDQVGRFLAHRHLIPFIRSLSLVSGEGGEVTQINKAERALSKPMPKRLEVLSLKDLQWCSLQKHVRKFILDIDAHEISKTKKAKTELIPETSLSTVEPTTLKFTDVEIFFLTVFGHPSFDISSVVNLDLTIDSNSVVTMGLVFRDLVLSVQNLSLRVVHGIVEESMDVFTEGLFNLSKMPKLENLDIHLYLALPMEEWVILVASSKPIACVM